MSKPSRGRPVDQSKQAEQKKKLIEATQRLLSEKSFRAITIREIAEAANINSAMIRYYFENKEGLFKALLDRMAEQHFDSINTLSSEDNPIRAVIRVMLDMLLDNASMARMIHDEVLQQESPLKDAFIERFPMRMAKLLPKLIAQELQVSDPRVCKYLAFNLISLIITPFIGDPVRKIAWKISDEELRDPFWAEHLYTLFISGSNYISNRIDSNSERKL